MQKGKRANKEAARPRAGFRPAYQARRAGAEHRSWARGRREARTLPGPGGKGRARARAVCGGPGAGRVRWPSSPPLSASLGSAPIAANGAPGPGRVSGAAVLAVGIWTQDVPPQPPGLQHLRCLCLHPHLDGCSRHGDQLPGLQHHLPGAEWLPLRAGWIAFRLGSCP
ncbi:uncharacterized protein LOC104649958 isoform X2 [Saimiri boliviensis]|uniref:uncharacterized protein LOC104649958 isoform X2 n=1 Tax=Saimiri boliviensis TaxID=27679 RepID=UPI003D7735CD